MSLFQQLRRSLWQEGNICEYLNRDSVIKRCKVRKKYPTHIAYQNAKEALIGWALVNKDRYNIDPYNPWIRRDEPPEKDFMRDENAEEYYYFTAIWPSNIPF